MSQDTIQTTGTRPLSQTDAGTGALLEDFYELTKPRLSFLSVVTAVVGYLAASPARDFPAFFALLLGTSLAAGGAAVLNQWLEREADAHMIRTRNRPIPAGRVHPLHALIYGLGMSVSGCATLYFGAHPLAGSLAGATIASYVLLYTPLKRVTTWNTVVGAIPGALPPLIGWAAAEGSVGLFGWLLFAILFLWQLPHFFAIAWTHRKDYARGGFVMLSNADANGARVAAQSFIFSFALVLVSLLPVFLGYTSWFYGSVALALGAYMLKPAIRFLRPAHRDLAARRLFIASICYLPALLVPLVLDVWLIG